MSDLWQLNVSDMLWTWLGGGLEGDKGVPLSYGVRGIAAPGNSPGIRYAHTAALVPQTGSLLIFGGLEVSYGGKLRNFNYYQFNQSSFISING